jgi:hypothetical protein
MGKWVLPILSSVWLSATIGFGVYHITKILVAPRLFLIEEVGRLFS